MKDQTPTYFDKSPLIEVVFEIRFKPNNSFATNALNAFLQKALQSQQSLTTPPFEPMDGLQIPKELKEQNSDLWYVGSYRVKMSDHSIVISDGSISITQEKAFNPYQGWNKFRSHIQDTIQRVSTFVDLNSIDRFSLKYSDFIEKNHSSSGLSLLKFSATLGDIDLTKANFDLQIDQKISEGINVVTRLCPSVTLELAQTSLHSPEELHTSKTKLFGLIYVTDAICFFNKINQNIRYDDPSEIQTLFLEKLEELHNISKTKFVSSFTTEAFELLGAHYD